MQALGTPAADLVKLRNDWMKKFFEDETEEVKVAVEQFKEEYNAKLTEVNAPVDWSSIDSQWSSTGSQVTGLASTSSGGGIEPGSDPLVASSASQSQASSVGDVFGSTKSTSEGSAASAPIPSDVAENEQDVLLKQLVIRQE